MNHRLFTPAAAIAAVLVSLVTLLSPPLAADPASANVVATGYNNSTKVLAGVDSAWTSHQLRISAVTTHTFADLSAFPTGTDPATGEDYPPDPCLTIGAAWNVAVYNNRPQASFDPLLKQASTAHCSLALTRAPTPNADGTTNVLSITVTH